MEGKVDKNTYINSVKNNVINKNLWEMAEKNGIKISDYYRKKILK